MSVLMKDSGVEWLGEVPDDREARSSLAALTIAGHVRARAPN